MSKAEIILSYFKRNYTNIVMLPHIHRHIQRQQTFKYVYVSYNYLYMCYEIEVSNVFKSEYTSIKNVDDIFRENSIKNILR